MDYRKRFIESEIDDLLEIFPIVSLTGPRQSGKSTLIKHYISKKNFQFVKTLLFEGQIVIMYWNSRAHYTVHFNTDKNKRDSREYYKNNV